GFLQEESSYTFPSLRKPLAWSMRVAASRLPSSYYRRGLTGSAFGLALIAADTEDPEQRFRSSPYHTFDDPAPSGLEAQGNLRGPKGYHAEPSCSLMDAVSANQKANGKLSLRPTMAFLEFRLSGFEIAGKPRAPRARLSAAEWAPKTHSACMGPN